MRSSRGPQEHLRDYVQEFRPPRHGSSGASFFLFNWSFQAVDAELLYAIVRHAKPARIIELGSGFSTLVMAQAAWPTAPTGVEHPAGRVQSVSPAQPRGSLDRGPELTAADARPGHPDERVRVADGGDILFVDTTHTVKLGSEVNRVVLDVLPGWRPACWSTSTMSSPVRYPRWLIERWGAWNEQYLLQAFLSGNARYEVLLAFQAMARHDPVRLAALVPSYNTREHYPMGFWIRSASGLGRACTPPTARACTARRTGTCAGRACVHAHRPTA